LLGYASIMAVLAEEQRAGRLHITPRVVFCVADPLTGAMRQRIEQTWQAPVYNSYGTTEGGMLAAECSAHQGLHLFEDFSIVEVVDEHNRPVPAGEQGARVLLTVLFRRTQPLIRYELSDLVRPSVHQQCACGRPFALLENIEGRAIEVLYFPAVSGKQERVSPYLFHTLFHPLPLSGWQVVQEPDGLHIFLTGASSEFSDDGLRDLVRGALIKRGLLVPAIKIQRVAALYKNASGKTPLVLPHLPPETSR
jgi:phenylacetate-coenzyme A ligase PaaK-like adenylate-forming protein